MIYDAIVVGNGIAANWILYHLIQSYRQVKTKKFHILHIAPASENDLYNCSYNSMATVSLNGVRKNVSLLGDLLCDSFEYFSRIIEQEKFLGVECVQKINFIESEGSPFTKRFSHVRKDNETYIKEKAFVIDPALLIKQLQLRCREAKNTEIHRHSSLFSSFKNIGEVLEITTLDNKKFKTYKLYNALGVFNNVLADKPPKINNGFYFKFKNIRVNPLPEEASIFAIPKFMMVYRKDSKELLVTGESVKNINFSSFLLLENLSMFKNILSKLDSHNYTVHQGKRAMGKKMMPDYKEIAPNVFRLGNLGKNGFLLSPYLAEKIINAQ